MLHLPRFALAVFITAAVLMLMAIPSQVNACSGGPGPTFETRLNAADLIVKARVIESDVARQNYILQVESYLTGEAGSEFIMLTSNNPDEIQGLLDTKLGNGDCYWFSRPLPQHELGYFGLTSLPNGVYSFDWIGFVIWESGFPVSSYDEGGELIAIYNQADFEQHIFDLHNSQHTDPLPMSRYPSTAPLRITTENGDEYLLPVSGVELSPITPEIREIYIPVYMASDYERRDCSWDCITWSGDGRTLILPLKNRFAYIQVWWDFRFRADHFLVSPISLAVWLDNTLTIYSLHDQVRYASSGSDLELREIGQTTLELNDDVDVEHSAWSVDGRLLAFSDARGLWLWDVFTPDSSPSLLRPADSEIPIALAFSGRGRYLSVMEGDDRFILDLLTDHALAFGYMSPDEMLIVRCEAAPELAPGTCRIRLEQLAPRAALPGMEIIVEENIRVEWVNERRVIMHLCLYEEDICTVVDIDAYAYDHNAEWPGGYDISLSPYLYAPEPMLDFAVQGRNVAILIDDDTVDVNGTTLHFELDSPIAEIRWLPSLFYGENPYPPQIRNEALDFGRCEIDCEVSEARDNTSG